MTNAELNPNKILEKILKRNVDQAEVYLSSSKTLQIDVLNQKVESIDEIRDMGYGIRVIKDKRLGFAFSSDLDKDILEETIHQAIHNAKNAEIDEFNALPIHQTTNQPIHLDLFDEQINKIPIQDKINLALQIEQIAYSTDKRVKKTQNVSYSDSEVEVWLVNSNGFSGKFKSNLCGASAQMIASHDGTMEMGVGMDYVKKFIDLAADKIGQEAAQRAVNMLGAKVIPSQKIPLVLDPFVVTSILGILATALSSDAVQKGKSLFADKLGQAVSSDVLSIIDNGRLPGGLDSSPFDAEGVPTQETKLIDNGVLKTFLFNTYTANKGKSKSTGNAVRGSFKGQPTVGTTNLYIPAGSQSPDELIKSINKGLYVQLVMGIHTANPISGDFSIGAAGYMIENGEKTHPVRGITIAGNLIDMLKAVEAVGSDLRFFADVGAPTLLISDVSVSGA